MDKRYWKREAYFYASQAVRNVLSAGAWADHDKLKDDPDTEDGRRFCEALAEVADMLEKRG